MNKQFETAYNIFRDFYGEPKWNENPKTGQSPDAIMEKWCEELKGYSVDQIRQACAWITRKRRVMTFPTLDVLLCELSDKEKEVPEVTPEAVYKGLIFSNINMSKLAAQRAVYRVYGVEIDGYRASEDIGG